MAQKPVADIQVTAKVPPGIVNKLKDEPGGINPIIDDLKRNHKFTVTFDGKSLSLEGTPALTDLAIEFLQDKVGRGARTAATASLGGQGTVVWTFKEKRAIYIQQLFTSEQNALSLLSETVKYNNTLKPEVSEIFCGYSDFPIMKDKMDELEQQVKKCKCLPVDISSNESQLVEHFEKNDQQGHFYCLVNSNMCQLEFYGREEKDCEQGITLWKSYINSSAAQANGGPDKSTSLATEPHQIDANSVSQKEMLDVTKLSCEAQTPEQPSTNSHKTSALKTDAHSAVSTVHPKHTSNTESIRMKSSTASDGLPFNSEHLVTSGVLKREAGKITGSGEKTKYSFQLRGIHIYVYKKSITEIRGMDAVTNAANERMMHAGGVAYYISKAAGTNMVQDCKTYISKKGTIPVTQNYVSIPGDMHCKGIIHAVGPQWWDYRGKEDDCAKDLCDTIKNVLRVVNDKKWRKVALTAISSGLFGVPQKLCAEMYIKAFVDFVVGDGSLEEVHFIAINRDILDLVIAAHKEWVTKPSALDFTNALNYSSVTSNSNYYRRGHDESQVTTTNNEYIITFDEKGKTAYGAVYYRYIICEQLRVYVYSGSLTRLDDVDAIALIVQPGHQGGVLADAVRTAAGAKYIQEIKKYKSSKNGEVFVCQETGKMPCKYIVHFVSDVTSPHTVANAYRRLLTHAYSHNIRSLVVPLFGSGLVHNNTDLQTLSNSLITTLVDVCSTRSKHMQITELRIVNIDPKVNTTLQDEFNKLVKQPGYKNTSKSKMGSLGETREATQHGSYHVSQREAYEWTLHTPLQDNKYATTGVLARTVAAKPNSVKPPAFEKAPSDSKCDFCGKKADVKLECKHTFCTVCSIPMKNTACMKCSTTKPSEEDKECPICMEVMTNTKTLPCNHQLCTNCYESVKKYKPQCPICQHMFGKLTGNQPNGSMYYRRAPTLHLPGYERFDAIEIYYKIPRGKQEKCHPNPGKPYKGIERTAYLPDNDEGNVVLRLLRMAFDRKLVFTVGESRTTGKEGVVTWNDIHHKTKPDGGTERFGYPDPTYLVRVKEELAAKGVTL